MTRSDLCSAFSTIIFLCSMAAQAGEQPERVACIGDSITFGHGVKNRNENSFPAQLGTMLGKGYEVRNFGVSASTMLKKGNKPYWQLKQFEAAQAYKPNIVIIKLGTNDTKPGNWQHKADFEPNYVEMVKTFQALESKPDVWICYPVPVFPERWGINDETVRGEVIPIVDRVAAGTGARVIDLYAPLAGKPELVPDKVHPNAAGATVIAKTIFAALTGKAPPKAEERIVIWPAGTEGVDPSIPENAKPCNKRFYNIHNPYLTVYRPREPNGTAVILTPGGGYGYVASGIEGVPNAAKLNAIGVTAFVLKYRLPATHKHPSGLLDALRAIQVVRHRAKAFGIQPNKVGVMGFSAGGHLASMAGTLFHQAMPVDDEVSKQSARPDFVCLVYPVISAHVKGVAHGCPRKLLPEGATVEDLKALSSDLNVTKDTPPTFLAHARDDGGVPCRNSELMHAALKTCGVPTELRLYDKGGHGGGFGREGTDSSQWFGHFTEWMRGLGLLP